MAMAMAMAMAEEAARLASLPDWEWAIMEVAVAKATRDVGVMVPTAATFGAVRLATLAGCAFLTRPCSTKRCQQRRAVNHR